LVLNDSNEDVSNSVTEVKNFRFGKTCSLTEKTLAVKNQTPDLRTSDQRKLGPENVRKIEESAATLLVKSWGAGT
jgi:hypothetical protein